MRAWLAALRIARREARRAKGRSLLVVALIGLPVMALAWGAATYDTFRLTPEERITRDMGAADAVVAWPYDGPVSQHPTDPERFLTAPGTTEREPATDADLLGVLPPGSRAVAYTMVGLPVRTAAGTGGVDAYQLDYGDPVARGLYAPTAGRPPATAGEVALSPGAARRIGTGLGSTLTSADGRRSWRVVGLVDDPRDVRHHIALFRPGALPADAQPAGRSNPYARRWLVDTPAPLSWAAVKALNRHGVLAESRAVVLDPPPASEVDMRMHPPVDGGPLFALGTLFGGVLVLEVVLLVGPAFAVGARRRRRDLALIAAAGGTPAHLRRIVLADGVVLGAVAAVAGLVPGILAAAATRPLVRDHLMHSYPGAFRVYPAALAAVAAVALTAGVLAALVPAWLAARQPVVAALTGRYVPARRRRWWAVAGVVTLAIGAAVAALGSRQVSAIVTVAGLVIAELGVVLCTPTLVGVVARLGGRLPLAPRIALRDIGRNRAAAAPAICAVLAAVAVSGMAATLLAAQHARSVTQRGPLQVPEGYVVVSGSQDGPAPAADTFPALEAAVRASVPATAVTRIGRTACASGGAKGRCHASPVLPKERICPFLERSGPLNAADRRAARRDPRCGLSAPTSYGNLDVAVVAPEALGDLLRLDPATLDRAARTLRDGGIVVSDEMYVSGGQVDVGADRMPAGANDSAPPLMVRLPGFALPAGTDAPPVLLGPAGVARLGLTSEPYAVVAATSRMPSTAEHDRLRALAGVGWIVSVVRYPPNDLDTTVLILALVAGVITLGAAAIATGLAAADSRADLATLAAVGAAPGVRRLLSLSQSGVIAGLGSLLGVVAGVGAAAAVIAGTNRTVADTWPVIPPLPMTVPWLNIGVALVVVPLVAMLGAGLLTRGRLPIERRM